MLPAAGMSFYILLTMTFGIGMALDPREAKYLVSFGPEQTNQLLIHNSDPSRQIRYVSDQLSDESGDDAGKLSLVENPEPFGQRFQRDADSRGNGIFGSLVNVVKGIFGLGLPVTSSFVPAQSTTNSQSGSERDQTATSKHETPRNEISPTSAANIVESDSLVHEKSPSVSTTKTIPNSEDILSGGKVESKNVGTSTKVVVAMHPGAEKKVKNVNLLTGEGSNNLSLKAKKDRVASKTKTLLKKTKQKKSKAPHQLHALFLHFKRNLKPKKQKHDLNSLFIIPSMQPEFFRANSNPRTKKPQIQHSQSVFRYPFGLTEVDKMMADGPGMSEKIISVKRAFRSKPEVLAASSEQFHSGMLTPGMNGMSPLNPPSALTGSELFNIRGGNKKVHGHRRRGPPLDPSSPPQTPNLSNLPNGLMQLLMTDIPMVQEQEMVPLIPDFPSGFRNVPENSRMKPYFESSYHVSDGDINDNLPSPFTFTV